MSSLRIILSVIAFACIANVNSQNNKYDDLDTWEPPKELSKKLPYYISGYDFEQRPVIVMEYGKWDSHKYIEEGGDTFKTYEKYVAQFWHRLGSTKSPFEDASSGVVVIMDADGLDNSRLANPAILRFILEQSRQFNNVADNIDKYYIVNANFVMETLINLVRPIAGRIFEKLEVFGTNKERWYPKLLKEIPKDQIPEWYGGSKDFKPVKVYG